MPIQQLSRSFQQLRDYMEKWQWRDPHSGITTTGYNVPQSAIKTAKRVPVHLKFLTLDGRLEQGNVVCLKVDVRRHQRTVQFVESKEFRRVCDYLILEVDGTRFYAH